MSDPRINLRGYSTIEGDEMKAKQLVNLIDLVKRLEDRVLYEVASCPMDLLGDREDRIIVQVAAGERAWRLECQK